MMKLRTCLDMMKMIMNYLMKALYSKNIGSGEIQREYVTRNY